MKNKSQFVTRILFLSAISVLFFTADYDEATQFGFSIMPKAEAVMGRPLTPVSVAGVRRRTRRRTAVATAAVVSTPVVVAAPAVVSAPVVVSAPAAAVATGTIVSSLPSGCTTLTSAGTTYHSCNGVYYKPAFQADRIVYMAVDQPS